MQVFNLLATIPKSLPEELFTTLLTGTNVRVERIVSRGHASPPGFWYDQTQPEWILVLRGMARLRIEGEPAPIVLGIGDSLTIPAHQRHRVEWTMPTVETVWLAIFYDPT